MRKSLAAVCSFIKRHLTWRGLALLVFWIVAQVPNWFGIRDFWRTHLRAVWHFIADHSMPVLTVVIGALIWLDHQRILNKRMQPDDSKTLRGRTLQFCDDLETFKKELGSEPPINWKTGNT